MNLFNKARKIPDADQEHQISLPGIDIAFNHALKLVILVDQTGSDDSFAMSELEKWIVEHGYFLHCVTVAPPPEVKEK